MAIAYRAVRTRQLTDGGLVLARGWRHMHLLWGGAAGLLVAVLAVGAYFALAPEAESVRELAHARHDNRLLQKNLEQSQLAARMSEARARELERQIDSLNQRLREIQDELAFFRKAQETKR